MFVVVSLDSVYFIETLIDLVWFVCGQNLYTVVRGLIPDHVIGEDSVGRNKIHLCFVEELVSDYLLGISLVHKKNLYAVS